MKNVKNMGKTFLTLLTGMLLGAALFSGGVAHAAEIFYKAVPSTNTVYLDGQRVELAAFAIDGSNYVKLRDVGELMGFNVYWDGAVQIDSDAPYTGVAPDNGTEMQSPAPVVTETVSAPLAPTLPETSSGQPYTISTDHWSRTDFSQQANPAVFTGVYNRDLYNTIRQTIMDGNSDTPAYTMVAKGDEYSAVKNLLGRLEGVLRYEHYVPQNLANYYEYLDYFAVSAAMPENYKAPYEFIRPVIEQANRLGSDREKVVYLNDYLCTLLTYKNGKTAGVTSTFSTHSGELEAACGSYARAFKFLCGAAGIPCFTISTTDHTWNMVYVDGQWLHVDVSANDLYRQQYILLTNTVQGRIDRAPEQTAFLKELLVPGSTK